MSPINSVFCFGGWHPRTTLGFALSLSLAQQALLLLLLPAGSTVTLAAIMPLRLCVHLLNSIASCTQQQRASIAPQPAYHSRNWRWWCVVSLSRTLAPSVVCGARCCCKCMRIARTTDNTVPTTAEKSAFPFTLVASRTKSTHKMLTSRTRHARYAHQIIPVFIFLFKTGHPQQVARGSIRHLHHF